MDEDEDCTARWSTHTNITAVTRTIRSGALSRYYENNVFILAVSTFDMPGTLSWLRTRPTEAFAVMSAIVLVDGWHCQCTLDGCWRVQWINLSNLKVEKLVLAVRSKEYDMVPLACFPCDQQWGKDMKQMKKSTLFKRRAVGWSERVPTAESIGDVVKSLTYDEMSLQGVNMSFPFREKVSIQAAK